MALPKKTPGTITQVNTWEKELAEQAALAAGQEQNTVGGQFFSLKSGMISFDGTTFPGNEIAVIILDGIMENVLYEGAYDAENPSSPACFAFGRDEKSMCPHEIATKKQSDQCSNCPMNQWGTAVKQDGSPSRGKACRNTRRLALIPAGNFVGGQFRMIDDPAHYAEAKLAFMKLPVTSVKAYAGFVKQVASSLQRPPHGVITKIKTVPDMKNQFSVLFEVLGAVPNAFMETIMQRHREAEDVIDFPYQPMQEIPQAVQQAKAKKPAATRRY